MSADLTDLQEAPAATAEREAPTEAGNEQPADGTAGKAEEAPEAPPPRPAELWHCRQEAWATLPNGWNSPVQSPEFRHWLVGECVRLRQSSKKARIDALLEVYTAVALYEGLEHQLHLRTAPDGDGGVYIDLADQVGRTAHVSREEWRIIPRAPAKFYRPPNRKALPDNRLRRAGGGGQNFGSADRAEHPRSQRGAGRGDAARAGSRLLCQEQRRDRPRQSLGAPGCGSR